MHLTLMPSKLVNISNKIIKSKTFTPIFKVQTTNTFQPLRAINASADAIPRVILKGGKSKLFSEHQSPTVYGGAIDRVVGRPAPKAGDPVLVCNGAEEPFAWGLFNPNSMYRVRIMQTLDDIPDFKNFTVADVPGLITARMHAAAALRQAIGLPVDHTNVYRLINSEGDRLSGLVVDVLNSVAVVQASASWVEIYRAVISNTLLDNYVISGIESVVWRRASELTNEEGWNEDDTISNASEHNELVKVVEAGLEFIVNPIGQKTGFYCDQRQHRAFIRKIAKGKEVLDICCYSGGFALNAVAGGAAKATGVDSSGPAIELARQNALINGFDESRCQFLKEDSSVFMKDALKHGKQWDIVILDPPKLAPTKQSLIRAWRKYEGLNSAAMRLVKPQGILMTCSCSGAVAQSGDFVQMLQRAAKRAKRRIAMMSNNGAAPDHPLDPGYPEGRKNDRGGR